MNSRHLPSSEQTCNTWKARPTLSLGHLSVDYLCFICKTTSSPRQPVPSRCAFTTCFPWWPNGKTPREFHCLCRFWQGPSLNPSLASDTCIIFCHSVTANLEKNYKLVYCICSAVNFAAIPNRFKQNSVCWLGQFFETPYKCLNF